MSSRTFYKELASERNKYFSAISEITNYFTTLHDTNVTYKNLQLLRGNNISYYHMATEKLYIQNTNNVYCYCLTCKNYYLQFV